MFGPELMDAFREFKSAWDPDNKMNPSNIVDAPGVAAHLRLGADYKPAEPATHFKFVNDHGSLAHAALRCAGLSSGAQATWNTSMSRIFTLASQ